MKTKLIKESDNCSRVVNVSLWERFVRWINKFRSNTKHREPDPEMLRQLRQVAFQETRDFWNRTKKWESAPTKPVWLGRNHVSK